MPTALNSYFLLLASNCYHLYLGAQDEDHLTHRSHWGQEAQELVDRWGGEDTVPALQMEEQAIEMLEE